MCACFAASSVHAHAAARVHVIRIIIIIIIINEMDIDAAWELAELADSVVHARANHARTSST